MIQRFLFCMLILLAGLSCGKVSEFGKDGDGGAVTVEFSFNLQSPPTRSSFCPAELDRISDINIWIYLRGALLENYSFYCEMPMDGRIGILFPASAEIYDIYMLANTGAVSGPTLESDIAEACVSFEDYSSFSEKGFPMAGSVLGFIPSHSGSATLSRLVGRYDIRIYDNPANTLARYTFLSARMKSCAKTVRPFSEVEGESGYASRAVSASEIIEDGDYLSVADLDALNEGRTVTLYYLENCQGLLLPDNDTQHGKSAEAVAEATGDASRAGLCSYLELRCRALTPTAEYGTVIYRAFLGKDACSDFSVVRNTINGYTIDMASNLINAEDWFVEPETPAIRAHMAVTVQPPIPYADLDSSGWDKACCPQCGAPWGGDDYRFSLTGESNFTPSCSCGWTGREVSQDELSSSQPLYLYDFLAADLYVSSDLKFGDTYSATFSSSGTDQGMGFTVERTRYSETVDCLRIIDQNVTSASTFYDAPYIDTLVIASYDGLIKRKYKVYGITHAVPIGIEALGLNERTAGFRVFLDDNPAQLSVAFRLYSQTLQASSAATYNTAPNQTFRCSGSYDVPLELMSNYVSTCWEDIKSINPGYRDKYGYIGGNLDVTGVSAPSPYVITGEVKLGIDTYTAMNTLSFSGSGGIYNGSMGSGSNPRYYLNLYASATGRLRHSSLDEGKGNIWTMFRMRGEYDGQLLDIRTLSNVSRYWSYIE